MRTNFIDFKYTTSQETELFTAKQLLYGYQIGRCRLERLNVDVSSALCFLVDIDVDTTEFKIHIERMAFWIFLIFIFVSN